MKRRFSIVLCIILVFTLLAGCAQEPSEHETAPPSEPPQATASPVTEPPPPADPINVISGTVFDSPVSFQLINRYTAGVLRYEYPDEEYMDYETYLDVLDLYSGTITASTKLDNSEYLYTHSAESGLLIIANYEESCFRLLDARLNTVKTIPVPNSSGLFNTDLSKYYYEDCGILTVMDTATGTSTPIAAASEYRFNFLEAFLPQSNAILGAVRTSLFSYDTANIIINPDTGEVLLLSDIAGIVDPTASGICCEIYDDEAMISTLRYSDLKSDTFFDLPSDSFGGINTYATALRNSDYLLVSSFSEEATTACSIFHIGETVTAYDLDMTQFTEGLLALEQSPDGNLVGVQRYGDGYCFCILCPDRLPFEEVCLPVPTDIPRIDPTALDALDAEQNLPLPEELAPQRARADALEETYGITILLSSQCEIPASYCGFPVTTTDKAEWMDEAEYIDISLNELESALQLYPEGFFRQFRNDIGEFGLLVLLVESFESANNTIGVHYTIGDWQCIAADISWTSAINTYCHEIWHATENIIQSVDYGLLDDETWNTFNPERFIYSYDETLGYLDDTEWTYLEGGCGSESYFVDSYSRVNEKEDRARIMEYVMAFPETADGMMEAPALRQKLQAICDAVRQTFDTTGWEEVCWERYCS